MGRPLYSYISVVVCAAQTQTQKAFVESGHCREIPEASRSSKNPPKFSITGFLFSRICFFSPLNSPMVSNSFSPSLSSLSLSLNFLCLSFQDQSSPALDDCLKLLKGERDEQRLAGLLLVTKFCKGDNLSSLLTIYHAVGVQFLDRLLRTGTVALHLTLFELV